VPTPRSARRVSRAAQDVIGDTDKVRALQERVLRMLPGCTQAEAPNGPASVQERDQAGAGPPHVTDQDPSANGQLPPAAVPTGDAPLTGPSADGAWAEV
jgi:hypothetical protein